METTPTPTQLRALRAEAAAAGDLEQVAVCDRALGRVVAEEALEHVVQTARGPVAVWDLRQDEAAAECARVLADARAQY